MASRRCAQRSKELPVLLAELSRSEFEFAFGERTGTVRQDSVVATGGRQDTFPASEHEHRIQVVTHS